MAAGNTSGKGGGAGKYGRNKKSCERYMKLHMREKHKVRDLKKHIKNHPNDLVAPKALKEAMNY